LGADRVELAQIAVDITAEGTDRLYTYSIPADLQGRMVPGQWVRVSFGRRHVVGLYLGLVSQAPDGVKVKEITGLLPEVPPLPHRLIDLARWTADRYLSTFAAALRLLLPPEARRQEVRSLKITEYKLLLEYEVAQEISHAARKRAPRQADLLQHLVSCGGEASLPDLIRAFGDGIRPAIRIGLERGWIEEGSSDRRRDPFGGEAAVKSAKPTLTPEQSSALGAIQQEMLAPPGIRQPILIHGVTGSGKTELYLRAIETVLQQEKQSICLVPEISLTPQMIQRFRSRFGEAVAVLHSALSAGERFDEWQRIRRGHVSIVVGARSAIFAPFDHVGLIIMDEEHEHSYKQEGTAPCYHAREVAEERCRLEGAALVLGSATPSLESFQKADSGSFRLVSLDRRVDDRPMPHVTLVDMRAELRRGNRSIFSTELQVALDQTIAAGQQAILFLNRRGYNTFVMCRSCGEAIQCQNCAVAMTFHLGDNHLNCHYCDAQLRLPKTCPTCKSTQIRHMGAGTEMVVEELRKLHPQITIARMDVDTTRRKGAHAAILKAFGDRKTDVLVGTQMIAKGLDFPDVTLVGVVLADTSLNLPDFRAAERTFQLVTQVAGRAGRDLKLGRVVVQSYQPSHYSLTAAGQHDYHRFYKEEILFRRQMSYPPFANLIHLVLSGPEEEAVAQTAQAIAELLAQVHFSGAILGPSPAPLAKLRGQFRYQLILKGEELGTMSKELRAAFSSAGGKWRRSKAIKLSVDVGPMSIL